MPHVKIYKALYQAIYIDGTLKEPFTVEDVRRICPGLLYTRYYAFVACNCLGHVPIEQALFHRVGRGKYGLISHDDPPLG